MDLANTGVQTFLENLSGYITMHDGYVEFNPIGSFDISADITMYFT
ncbi:MAG: hypothetical protein WCJ39_09835 [bacterium]